MIQNIQGDIFESDAQALVNPVNCVGVMGKGLAAKFKDKYRANFYAYRDACMQNQVKIGRMYVFRMPDTPRPRFIINFPTKRHWQNPSELSFIEGGLRDLTRVIQSCKIKSVAIPALGAGLGGLSWDDVRQLIEKESVYWAGCDVLLYAPH